MLFEGEAKRVSSGAKLAILRMALDVCGHERAARDDSEAALTRVLERANGQLRRNAAAAALVRHVRMVQLETLRIELAVGDLGSLAADVGREATGIGLVANRERHCRCQGTSPALQGGASPASRSARIDVRRASSLSLSTPTTLP